MEAMTTFPASLAALKANGSLFSPDRPICYSRAPGRLDLMGGNDDYTGGLVFDATIREATWAGVQLRSDRRIVFLNPQMKERGWHDRVEFSLDDLTTDDAVRGLVNHDPGVRWTAYVLGLFHLLQKRFPQQVQCGVSAYIESDVPLNKGVSSSASVEVAVMKAAVGAYGINLTGVELAEACQWVENVIAESACGIMDQDHRGAGGRGLHPAVALPALSAAPTRALAGSARLLGRGFRRQPHGHRD